MTLQDIVNRRLIFLVQQFFPDGELPPLTKDSILGDPPLAFDARTLSGQFRSVVNGEIAGFSDILQTPISFNAIQPNNSISDLTASILAQSNVANPQEYLARVSDTVLLDLRTVIGAHCTSPIPFGQVDPGKAINVYVDPSSARTASSICDDLNMDLQKYVLSSPVVSADLAGPIFQIQERLVPRLLP